MPLLDVTEVIFDPGFATTFDVIRSVESVGLNGRATFAPAITAGVVGVVAPATTNDLLRLPDAERQGGAIIVVTTFALTSGDAGTSGADDGPTADQIIWPASTGRHYTVDQIDDFTQFGVGFVKATCRVRDLR